MSTIFATNRKDDKSGFYRIIQPLRFLKRSGWNARTVPFSGRNDVSVMPVSDSILVRLSKDTDFILTTPIMDEEELLRIMNLRKLNNCKWIVDISENIYSNNDLQPYLPIIERSLHFADGVIVPTEINKEIYKVLNENIYVLPSALDFMIWDNLKPVVSRKFKIGYIGSQNDLALVNPTLNELQKKYPIELLNIYTNEVIDVPKKIAKLGLSMAVFPMTDTNFNRCRTDIDILEVMALKIPVVASPTVAYQGLPVLYAKTNFQWYEAIEKIITDKKFRKEMQEMGWNFVHNEYDMKKYVGNLQSWLKSLPRKNY